MIRETLNGRGFEAIPKFVYPYISDAWKRYPDIPTKWYCKCFSYNIILNIFFLAEVNL